MESTIMQNSFATNNANIYGAHFATLLSDKVTFENNIGNFSIAYATPNLPSDEEYEKTFPKASTGNVINNDNLGTTKVTNSNAISLTVPKYMFYITDMKVVQGNNKLYKENPVLMCNPKIVFTRKEYTKGQVFVIVNTGGEVDNPQIVGVV